jgi:hypothetical protein
MPLTPDQELRAVALEHAVKRHEYDALDSEILASAQVFAAFIETGAVPPEEKEEPEGGE